MSSPPSFRSCGRYLRCFFGLRLGLGFGFVFCVPGFRPAYSPLTSELGGDLGNTPRSYGGTGIFFRFSFLVSSCTPASTRRGRLRCSRCSYCGTGLCVFLCFTFLRYRFRPPLSPSLGMWRLWGFLSFSSIRSRPPPLLRRWRCGGW